MAQVQLKLVVLVSVKEGSRQLYLLVTFCLQGALQEICKENFLHSIALRNSTSQT